MMKPDSAEREQTLHEMQDSAQRTNDLFAEKRNLQKKMERTRRDLLRNPLRQNARLYQEFLERRSSDLASIEAQYAHLDAEHMTARDEARRASETWQEITKKDAPKQRADTTFTDTD